MSTTSSSVSGRTPEVGKWDYDGQCAPASTQVRFDTFSVGIFQWLPKSRGKGLKRGKVVARVKGSTSDAEMVYAEAARTCEEWNARLLEQKGA